MHPKIFYCINTTRDGDHESATTISRPYSIRFFGWDTSNTTFTKHGHPAANKRQDMPMEIRGGHMPLKEAVDVIYRTFKLDQVLLSLF